MATCDRCENKIPGEPTELCAICRHWIKKMANAHDENLVDCVALLVAENKRLHIALDKNQNKPTEKEPSDES